MLCRVLLAATVLTYVICVLLLSGLQKGDLDTNTLEKLQRHNVNIYDMNNESLRQECSLKSLSEAGKETKTFVITEDPNDPLKRQIHKEPSIGNNVAKIQKSEVPAPEKYFIDKTNLREIDIKDVREKEHSSNVNVNEKPGDMNVTIFQENKDQQIKFIENNPTLERVMNFWVTFTQNTNTGSTKKTAITDSPTSMPEEDDTTKTPTSNSDNEGYLHSRKMNYINRMLAELLESQTVPTTTQALKKEATNIDIGTKIKAALAKNGQLHPINQEDIFDRNTREINELVEFINIFNKDQKPSSEKSVRTPQKEMNNNDNDYMEKSKDIPYRSIIDFRSETGDKKSDKNMQALKFLNDMLKVNHFRPNEHFNTTTQDLIVKNVEEEGREGPKQLGIHNENNSHRDREHFKNIIKVTNDPVQIPGRVVSADVIQEIAEKVKAIVMKDIMKEIPTSDTTVSCTTISTVKPTTPIKETNESSVIQTLLALFKEFKAIKDLSKTTTRTPSNISSDEKSKRSPSIIDTFNMYGVKPPVANAKQVVVNPYNHNYAPYLVGKSLPSTMHGPQTNFNQNIGNQVRPITIQTNSGEIPPLVIQMPRPMKVMNQHIILTTVKPTVKHTQEHVHHDNNQQLNYLDQNPIYGDLTKKLRIAENVKKEYRESYKDTIEKMKERIKYSPEHNHNQDREKGPFVSNHHVSHLDTNSHDTYNKHSNSNRHDIHNRAEDTNRHQNRSPESNYRDIITREFLSRLVDSNHHDIISELVASNPHNSRPNEKVDLNHQSQSHQSDAYERFEHERSHPRFKGHKFHEKLEGIENRPHNSYESHSKTTKKTCCEAVAAREQIPLSKIKPRPRFDDTHFRNFLKSQQKVTDMLERILAAKTKGNESKTQSNESS